MDSKSIECRKYIVADQSKIIDFLFEDTTASGLNKIADKVIADLHKICGKKAERRGLAKDPKMWEQESDPCVIYGVLGQSAILAYLEEHHKICTEELRRKREAYGFFLVENPFGNIPWSLIIAGSDKRGAIYGLFHISELLGVSPYVNWSEVQPARRSEIVLDQEEQCISKEPSVEYRGFFINDEWPAFGTWCNKRFGGFNADMYDSLFEVLLRLKGNYLWPAMWSASFAEDGPGLESAELADEYGIVMGLSHHEPCLRHGEEYSRLRGKDSPYGDAWDFQANREGIIRFWRDGLKRNGHLENIITIGMRGERDSAIMGKEASLEDNIRLLQDVIREQHTLIRECVDSDLTKVPRMLALYKEVEPYFYGDEKTAGLIEEDEIKDVILLLCDDNHGYLRSRPWGKMREHEGGYGMYYHFDYHGEPVSYEWVNSTYLPCVWEQMTNAYESGIQKLWIVNVGDFAFQEFPLNYFMDLAYDYERYGILHPNETRRYTEEWIDRQFAHVFSKQEREMLEKIITEYSRLNHNRRPEHMNEKIYAVNQNREAEQMLKRAKTLMAECQELMDRCTEAQMPAFYELVYYNVMASMNLLCMWLYRGFNHYLAGKGAVAANECGRLMTECFKRDESLKQEIHALLNGKWDGFAEARHIGFENWNSEESHNPVLETVFPVEDERVVVGVCSDERTTTGEEWTGKKLLINDFLHHGVRQAAFYLALASKREVDYSVECRSDWLWISKDQGTLSGQNPIAVIDVSYDPEQFGSGQEAKERTDGVIHVVYGNADVEIIVKAPPLLPKLERDVPFFVEAGGAVYMDAVHYSAKKEDQAGSFLELKDLGKNRSAMALFPAQKDFSTEDDIWLEYEFYIWEEGEYNLIFELEPANPAKFGGDISICYELNGQGIQKKSVLENGYMAGVSLQWAQEVMNHVRKVSTPVTCRKGENRIRFYAAGCENVLERICLERKGGISDTSYLGTKESFRIETENTMSSAETGRILFPPYLRPDR